MVRLERCGNLIENLFFRWIYEVSSRRQCYLDLSHHYDTALPEVHLTHFLAILCVESWLTLPSAMNSMDTGSGADYGWYVRACCY
jgi:hypothetical protein